MPTRAFFAVLTAATLTGCSSTSTTTASTAPEQAPAPAADSNAEGPGLGAFFGESGDWVNVGIDLRSDGAVAVYNADNPAQQQVFSKDTPPTVTWSQGATENDIFLNVTGPTGEPAPIPFVIEGGFLRPAGYETIPGADEFKLAVKRGS